MKKELIKTDNYLLVVDDSEIKEGDWFLTDDKRVEQSAYDWNARKWHKKIIAHLPLNDSPILEGVPLLPPLEVEDDVEKMAEEKWKLIENTGTATANFKNGYGSGYYKAKQKYRFTEEDIKKAINNAIVFYENSCRSSVGEYATSFYDYINNFIQSLSQPKIPTHFEFEMDKDYRYNDDGEPIGFKVHDSNKIKTITNAQIQIVACGKYIY